MAARLLTFEYDDDCLEIHGDEAGLRYLIDRIQRLIDSVEAGQFDHIHLMPPEWGGSTLSQEAQGEGDLIQHVAIHCWKKA